MRFESDPKPPYLGGAHDQTSPVRGFDEADLSCFATEDESRFVLVLDDPPATPLHLHLSNPRATLAIDVRYRVMGGVPRDWCTTVGLDHDTGLGWAGGYVGSGVTTTNLAGRTLCDLLLREDTELTGLPWVGRRVRSWEPEPLRWAGVRLIYTLYRAADCRENAGLPRTSAYARVAGLIAGS